MAAVPSAMGRAAWPSAGTRARRAGLVAWVLPGFGQEPAVLQIAGRALLPVQRVEEWMLTVRPQPVKGWYGGIGGLEVQEIERVAQGVQEGSHGPAIQARLPAPVMLHLELGGLIEREVGWGVFGAQDPAP